LGILVTPVILVLGVLKALLVIMDTQAIQDLLELKVLLGHQVL